MVFRSLTKNICHTCIPSKFFSLIVNSFFYFLKKIWSRYLKNLNFGKYFCKTKNNTFFFKYSKRENSQTLATPSGDKKSYIKMGYYWNSKLLCYLLKKSNFIKKQKSYSYFRKTLKWGFQKWEFRHLEKKLYLRFYWKWAAFLFFLWKVRSKAFQKKKLIQNRLT